MATNRVSANGYQLSVVCDNPTTPQTGDPVRFGYLTGVALTDEAEGGNPTGYTSVDFGPRVWDLSVKGVDGSGNSAVAVGDAIYYVDADTPKLSKKTTGYFFGFALETVSSGAIATITVLKVPSPGSGAFGTGTVTATNLASSAVETAKIAANAVTAAKLTATMAKGFIPLPIGAWREVVTNAIPNTAANGGLLASDTTPILERVNGATDKQQRINWAASNSDEITFGGIAYPPDLDDTAAVTVHVLAAMAGATDTPVLAISFFENTGDTNAGGNTAAVTGTGIAEYSASIAHGDVGAHPKVAAVGITPGAHTTDALYVYAAWIEYTRV
jgi:hypothetical protein